MRDTFTLHKHRALISATLVFIVLFFILLPKVFRVHYALEEASPLSSFVSASENPPKVFVPSYVATPDNVKGIYMTSWIASSEKLRAPLVKFIDDTELNSLVIDIKDYSGKIVFSVASDELKAYGSEEVRIKDLPEFIESLHKKGVYVIGRIAVFQDAYFVKYRPDLAVKNGSGTAVWKDKKGISWIDPGSREYWDYIILLGKESRKIGFDEINFDYIRFPSDGNMQDISYPWSTTTPKALILKEFFSYLHDGLQGSGLKISADLFGMVTTAQNDMGIGQLLENALPYFDYISPMVYPSHYPPTFMNFKNPEEHPYEVVHFAMQSAVERADKLDIATSTSPNPVVEPAVHYRAKLRPWLQDFGLRKTYGSAEIKAQIRAVNEAGLSSWLLWSPSNVYTKEALSAEE